MTTKAQFLARVKHSLLSNWPAAWVQLAESMVMIVSLGWYCPGWTFRWAVRNTMRRPDRGWDLGSVW